MLSAVDEPGPISLLAAPGRPSAAISDSLTSSIRLPGPYTNKVLALPLDPVKT